MKIIVSFLLIYSVIVVFIMLVTTFSLSFNTCSCHSCVNNHSYLS